ncbi:MAG: Lrp/AsnC family transcriptional regulator, partial [Methylococcales bacterium]
MDKLDQLIINQLQDGFPIVDSPYRQIAEQLNITEDLLLQRLQQLLDNGILSRFGPMYHAEKMG